ncbi:MAG: SMC-Scp complex subunit ScpB [Spirochaetes bacterium]|nr:SMC-Scp complex subunit ScpB [Spirochaetota bacterium]
MATIKDDVVKTNGPEAEPEEGRKDDESIKGLFEAVLFLSNEPVPLSFFVQNFSIDPTQAKIVLDSLVDEYDDRDGGIRIQEIARGFQFVTSPQYADQIRRVIGVRKREGLSKSMLETLAIIAYRQPIVLAEIEELRGVSSRAMVVKLIERNMVKPVGRKELPGRPLSYGTTNEFLRYFGLNRLSDLPKLSEIKEFSLNWDDEHGE